MSNQGARTDLGQNFGRNRLLEGIGGELDVIQRRLRELPGLAEQLGPPVDNVANRFRILARDGIAFTAEQARALRNDIAAVNSALDSRRNAADLFRNSFGGAGAPGLSLGVDARSLQGIGAQIELVQSRLASLGAEARGPVVAALDALRTRAAALFDAGTIDTTDGRRELQRLREEIIRTLAAADPGVSQGRLRELLARTGDVGRAGFDRFGLAVQQAAFVVDDFFSVTGGLDQRIRAIGNNISQLGFVLGGTSGLVAGVAASVTSQLVVALIRWANQNVETQDRVKVLNDALSRQKSLVEELAQAFRALGDSLTRGAFSPAAAQANEFRKELDEIIKKQKELREARAADIDPTVQRERATQGSLQRRLEQEENIGRRIALQQQIEASRRREREAAGAAAARPAATGQQSAAAIGRGGDALFDRVTRGQEVITPRDVAILDEARRRAGEAREAQSPAAIRDALVQQRDALISSGFGESDNRVADSIRQLEELIASLEAPIQRANDALVISILEGAKKVSVALTQAQESIARADFGPSAISDRANEVAKQLESLARQLEAASDEKTINALREQQAALLRQSVVLESAARSVEQFAAALDRVAGQLADTVLQEVDVRAVQARRDANAAQGAAAAGAGNVPAFRRPQFERDQQRQADEAQGDRRRIEAEAERARAAQLDFERIQRQFVASFERDATEGRLGPDAKRLIAQRNAATATLESVTAPAFERQQAATDLAEAEAALASLFEQSDLARHLAELADGLDVAAQAAVELDRQIKEQRASANRGRELTLTPAEKAAEELNQRIADIREYANRAAEESTGLPGDVAKIRAEMNKAIGRAVEDQEKAIAPLVFDLAEQVQNARMQGPSRAALGASDASTAQGQQELNRLLRGDDAARDQNLVELKRQTDVLKQIRDKRGAEVAN